MQILHASFLIFSVEAKETLLLPNRYVRDVQWKAEGGGPAGEGGAGAAGSQDGMAAASASGDVLTATLSVLPKTQPPPAATVAGTMASNEDHLLRVSFALRISQETYASLPSAGAPGSGSALSSAEQDISDFVKWGYKRGQFPLTPEGLLQMKFDHNEHPTPPKHAFPDAILLFVCIKRNDAEEACFQNLLREWGWWFDHELSFEILKKGPPLRLQFSADEINWCKVRLDFLVQQIKSVAHRL